MRRKVIVLGLVPAGIALGYFFYLGCALGFAASKYFGGRKAGVQGRIKSIVIPLKSYELHLHHWLLSAVAVTTSAIQGFSLLAPGLFYGILGGLVLQGIYCYEDWHRIVRRRINALPEVGGTH
ncbi:MAG TPA: hypothetical protein ENL12_00185 [Dehalococcoidia bacterium]|nr:hypothetical protein [Dehalococcoidia bacterium]